MPFLIQFAKGVPTSGPELAKWITDALQTLMSYMRALVYLDAPTRETRSLNAERAVLFVSAVVTNAAVTRMVDIAPQVQDKVYTSALVAFDAGSGAGRYRIDGGAPIFNSALAAAGMPIAAAGTQFMILGQLNIRDFQVAAETATAMDMSITLFQ